MDRDHNMLRALFHAQTAAESGEVPVGAVVVRDSDGHIAGEGRNRREERRDPTAHAEMEAIIRASQTLGGWRLTGCTLYVTLEPCIMCAGAIINARIGRVVCGAPDTSGSGGARLLEENGVAVLWQDSEECAAVIKSFFRERRKRMTDIKLVEARTEEQLKRTAAIADEIWHEYFPCILTPGQIDYMVEKFCSVEAEKRNIADEGYIYYIIKHKDRDIGYTAIKPDGDRLFLSKIYLLKEERGKGYARTVMDMHKAYAAEHGFNAIWLTVNRRNESSIAVYRALGFEKCGEGVTDIGGGYVMDDFYFELKVGGGAQ